MAQVYLYSNLTINDGNGIHYFFTNQAKFNTFINANLLTSLLTFNYRLNTDSSKVRLSLDDNITESNYKNITYLRYTDTINELYFFVRRAVIVSNCVDLYVECDLWATYLVKASISRINVIKSNRNVGTGIYDPITATNENVNEYVPIANITSGAMNQYFDVKKCSIVFVVNYNWLQKVNAAVSQTGTFAIDLYSIKDSYIKKSAILEEEITFSFANAVDIAIGLIQGIYGVESTGLTDNDAHVIQAYLVDNSKLLLSDGDVTFKSTSPFFEEGTFKAKEVLPFNARTNFQFDALDPNYEYYFGTHTHQLKLNRTTENKVNVTLDYYSKVDGLSIIMKQGSNQLDMTAAFSVNLSTASGDVVGFRTLINTISNGLTLGLKLITTDTLTAIGSGIGAVGSALAPTALKGGTIGNGDGATAFRDVRSSALDRENPLSNIVPVKNPFILTKSKSINDEKKLTSLNGANYNIVLDSISDVFAASFIGDLLNNTTYLKATALIDNIPLEASDLIFNKLANGIYCKQVL